MGWPYNEAPDGEVWAEEDRHAEELEREQRAAERAAEYAPAHGGYPRMASGTLEVEHFSLRFGLSIAEHAAMLRVHESDDGGL